MRLRMNAEGVAALREINAVDAEIKRMQREIAGLKRKKRDLTERWAANTLIIRNDKPDEGSVDNAAS